MLLLETAYRLREDYGTSIEELDAYDRMAKTAEAIALLGGAVGKWVDAHMTMRSKPLPREYGESADIGVGNSWGTTDDLVNSATTVGKGGVSQVGRAYQKHAGNPNRAGTFAGEVSGNAVQNTQNGTNYLNDILS